MAAKHSKNELKKKRRRAESYLFEDYIKSLENEAEQADEKTDEEPDGEAENKDWDEAADIGRESENIEQTDMSDREGTKKTEDEADENLPEIAQADEAANADEASRTDEAEEQTEKEINQDSENIDRLDELEREPERDEWENVKPMKKKSSGAGKLIAGLAVVCVLGAATYVGTGYICFGDKFREGTVINGTDCSNMTAAEAADSLKAAFENYKLDIYNGDTLIDSFSGKSIGLRLGGLDLSGLVKGQNKLFWAKKYLLNKDSIITIDYFNDKTVNMPSISEVTSASAISCEITYNKEILDSLIDGCQVNNVKATRTNESSTVAYDGSRFVVTEPVQGDAVDLELFRQRMYEYIAEGKDKLILQEADVYTKPNEVDTTALQAKADAANKQYSGISLSVKLGDTDKDLGNEIVTRAVAIGDDNSVTCNASTIKNAVNEVKAKYSTAGIARKFLTAHGGYTEVKGGDYGLAVNMYGVQAQAQNAILNKKPVSVTVPYVANTLNNQGDGVDLGGTYIEVDLTNQYCYVFVDGAKKYETPVVTGLPGSRATPQGVYMLKNKLMNVPLVGDNYVTPVKYWMPFNGGIGLHDAVWQSAFGGDRYRSKGSHGCVNLSMTSATNIYSFAQVGMPVVCYYYERLNNFNQVKSPDPVKGTFRALTAKERTMLASLKKGKRVSGAVYNSNAGANAKKYGSTNANAQTALDNKANGTIDPTAVPTEPITSADAVTTPSAF